ncbi:GDSL-like lipase/Acylhydrolase [Pochonia chlamydosporia 170]|uniref:GDSL-like lipase/Acylhydrolase n=1 Tax=Pochonia chlamydosporia 170 TaxID=1380566 RepID=A0A179G5X5_METCM|nr:GDSL-like lipase/Acylhydrolase [Pochonia chlamydosporia 170]OAQ72569.1 GDSL-like lipase/Acylhydrolase [Pochonia chlamydosporia 170]
MTSKTLSILCFGDSLTSGWHSFGMESHPYSIAFAARVQESLPDTKLEVHTSGVAGDVATFQRFQQRLEVECNKRNYDWVIILGGTNDLAYTIQPKAMYESFQSNWDVPLVKGSKVLALTIPESESRPAWILENRSEINSLILEHKERNFYSFDLHAKIPFHSLSEEDKDRYWDDGLHLTADGYDWMGNHIATGFLAALASAKRTAARQAAASGSSKGLTRTNDSTVFEEENGNPSRLSEGYVVVRKKDLW